jgi:hypothetical protein
MKAIATLLTTGLFAAGAYAGSGSIAIYGDLSRGNPDLSRWTPSAGEMTGVATVHTGSGNPDIYGGFERGNPELSQWQPSAGEEMTGVQPAIGDAPYGLGSSRNEGMFKSGSSETGEANRIDAYGEFTGPDLPGSF